MHKVADFKLMMINLFNKWVVHNRILLFHVTNLGKTEKNPDRRRMKKFRKKQHTSDRRLTRFRTGLGLSATGTEVKSQLT